MSVGPGQNAHQVELVLGNAPCDHGALHGLVAAAGKPLEHAGAAHAPAQAAENLPVMHTCRIDGLAAGGLVGFEQLFARAEPANRAIEFAEAPWRRRDPGEILRRVADMSDLPVEHGTHAFAAEDDVAVAKVAMHETILGKLGGRVLLQPAKCDVEHRSGNAKAVVAARKAR